MKEKEVQQKCQISLFSLYSEARQRFCTMALEMVTSGTRWPRPISSHRMAPAPLVGCRAAIAVLLTATWKFSV